MKVRELDGILTNQGDELIYSAKYTRGDPKNTQLPQEFQAICEKIQSDAALWFRLTGDYVSIAQDKGNVVVSRVNSDIGRRNAREYYGQSMIKATVEDVNGVQCGMTIFPKGLAQANSRIKDLTNGKHIFGIGCALHFAGTVNVYEDEVGIILEDLFSFQPCPQPPADLKAKKINLKLLKKEKVEETSGEMETEDILFEEIEDMLINEGLLDIDVDYDGDI